MEEMNGKVEDFLVLIVLLLVWASNLAHVCQGMKTQRRESPMLRRRGYCTLEWVCLVEKRVHEMVRLGQE